MVTVKHTDDQGVETTETFRHTVYDPVTNALTCVGGANGDKVYDSGRSAYVMNEQGKTVAAYNLRIQK